ncbi:MAG: heme ABC transporter permease CcmC [Cellvibrionaceae bacterium]
MGWQWFHRLGSPRWFYEKTARWTLWLGLLSLVLLAIGTIWGLGFAPIERVQGNSYRIIYLHVPVAFLSMAGYYVMAISGAIGLIWKMKLADMVMKSAAPIGVVLTFIALFTGAVWGKPTWGTWFEWRDPRIASTLLLFFLYLGVIALQASYQNQQMADRFSAILAIVGMVNIPIMYGSVYWWNSLHQGATLKLSGETSMHSSMLYPLLVMIAAFYCFYAYILVKNVRAEILQREYRTQWVKELVSG